MSKVGRVWMACGMIAVLSVFAVETAMATEPSASAEVRLAQGRSNTATLRSAGRRYVAVLTVRAVGPDDFLSRRAVGARSQIADLVITADGKQVAVPLSAIADGYDPSYLRLVGSKTGVIVVVSGSDGADGYSLEVVADGDRVSRRRILIAGDHVSEETRYREVVVE